MGKMSRMKKRMSSPKGMHAMPNGEVMPDEEMPPNQDSALSPETSEPKESSLRAMTDPKQAQTASPELVERLKKIQTLTIHLIYSKDLKDQMKKLLSQGEYAFTLPTATKVLYKNIRMIMKKQGQDASLEDKLAIALTAFSELLELGTAMGLVPQDIPEDEQESILRSALQDEIKEGLANGDIDPIELQEAIEPLLPQDFKDEGKRIAQSSGISEQPTQEMVSSRMKEDATRPLRVENERLRSQTQQQQTALKGFGQVASGTSGAQMGGAQ